MSSVSSMISKLEGPTSVTCNDAVSTKSPSLSEQFGKHKSSPQKSSSASVGSYTGISHSSGKSSPVGGGYKLTKTRLVSKKVAQQPTELEESLHGVVPAKEDDNDRPVSNAEATLKMLAKSAPDISALAEDSSLGRHSISGRSSTQNNVPDPEGAITPRSRKPNKSNLVSTTPRCTPNVASFLSPSSGRMTMRKTAIKASELGIDLSEVNSEKLGEAVKKWKAEQQVKSKPDPTGVAQRSRSRSRMDAPSTSRSKSRDRSRSRTRTRSTSRRGKDRDSTPVRSGGSISAHSRELNQSYESSPVATSTPKSPRKERVKPELRKIMSARADLNSSGHGVIKRKIIVRRRASAVATEHSVVPNVPVHTDGTERTSSQDDTSTTPSVPPLPPAEFAQTPDWGNLRTPIVESGKSLVMDSSEEVEPKRSLSRGRLAKARSDALEIQKRLQEAGVTDEQYRAMLAIGLSISIA